MLKALTVELVTPEGVVFAGEVDGLVAPGVEGYFGLLPNHAPIIAELQVGDLRVRRGTDWQHFAISGGMLHLREGEVTVIADAVERSTDIDVERARLAAERARQRLGKRVEMDIDPLRAEAALMRAINRLKVAGTGGM
jgi:F-type H+-transporting ATPase subunit epsilon